MGAVQTKQKQRRPLQGGSVYLPILLAATVAAVLTVGGLLMVQTHARASQIRSDAAVARAHALSGIEVARARIVNDINWRATNANGLWISNEKIGTDGGGYSVTVTNPFGALNRTDSDPVVITAVGTRGLASQTASVMLKPDAKVPLTCLNAAVASVGGVSFTSSDVLLKNVILASNGDVVASGASSKIEPDVEAVGVISGAQYKGTTTAGVAARTFPSATLFDMYPTATVISVASLPVIGTTPAIRNCVLSPAVNPFGATNARGIYQIDCAGGQLIIQSCRIVGTLIVKNATLVTVSTQVLWEPAESTLPALLVQGPVSLSGSAAALSEVLTVPYSGTLAGLNFNPTGTPYPYLTGSADADTLDTYTPLIDGLVYATGNVTLPASSVIAVHSLFSGGTITSGASAKLTLSRDTRYFDAPPPGFYTVRQIVLPGTYR